MASACEGFLKLVPDPDHVVGQFLNITTSGGGGLARVELVNEETESELVGTELGAEELGGLLRISVANPGRSSWSDNSSLIPETRSRHGLVTTIRHNA